MKGHDGRACCIGLLLAWLAVSAACRSGGNPELSASRADSRPCVVTEEGPVAHAVPTDALVGEFDLDLHVESGIERDSVVHGTMTLKAAESDTIHALLGSPFILFGWTSLADSLIGDVWMATALSSTDPARPGVLAIRNRSDSTVVLMLGAAAGGANIMLHSGLRLVVRGSDSGGFRGTWSVSSRRAQPPASGVFCAWRLAGTK
jgi:hypothetical protein